MSAGFVRLKRLALEREIPLLAHLELTYACNWRCVFCYNPRHFDQRPLATTEWLGVLDELRALGTLTVTLTGGEPLAHPEFFAIAQGASQRGFALKLFTNGALVDDAAADRIAALRPLRVELSLHGAAAATHDRTTGRAGSFDAMWSGIERLQERGVRLQLKTPFTRLNAPELDALLALGDSRGLPLRIDPTLTPRDDGDPTPIGFAAAPEDTRRLLGRLAQRGELADVQGRQELGVNCGLGRLSVVVDPEGNVFPCMQWRKSALGNVRQAPLRELWHASSVRREAATIATQANTLMLQRGGAEARFLYCPAVAFQNTGDELVPDAGFVQLAQLAQEAREP